MRDAHEAAALGRPPRLSRRRRPAPVPTRPDDLGPESPLRARGLPPSSPAAAPAPAPSRVPFARRARPGPPGARLDGVRADLVRAGWTRPSGPLLDGFTRSVMPFLDPATRLRDPLREHLASCLPTVREWKASRPGHAIAFVGQSGVGKTSAAVCLAGRYRSAGLAVALVAAGHGPHDSLEGHARRLDVQLFRAADGPALATLCATLADRDLVVIDTEGRSHQQLDEIEELAALLGPAKPAEVHLVLPTAASLADLGDVQRRFRMVGVNRLTMTKLDETRFHGNLLNLPMRMGKPLAFLSEGTSVPEALARPMGAASRRCSCHELGVKPAIEASPRSPCRGMR